MASTGPQLFASVSQTAAGGTTSFSNLSLAISNDADYANTASIPIGDKSYRIDAVDASAGLAPISGNTVDGIEITVIAYGSTGGSAEIYQSLAQLIIEGTLSGTNKATLGQIDGGPNTLTFGGPTDKWGLTPSAAQLLATNSGFAWQVLSDGGTDAATRVYNIYINVYYTAAGADADGGGITGPMESAGSASRTIPSNGDPSLTSPYTQGEVHRTVFSTGAALLGAMFAGEVHEAIGSPVIAAMRMHAIMSEVHYVTVSGGPELPPIQADGVAGPYIVEATGDVTLPAFQANSFTGFVCYVNGGGTARPLEATLVLRSTRKFTLVATLTPMESAGNSDYSEAPGTEEGTSGLATPSLVASGVVRRSVVSSAAVSLPSIDGAGLSSPSSVYSATGGMTFPGITIETITSTNTIEDSSGEPSLLSITSSGLVEVQSIELSMHEASGGVELGAVSVSLDVYRQIASAGSTSLPSFSFGIDSGLHELVAAEGNVGLSNGPMFTEASVSRKILATGSVDMPMPEASIGARIFRPFGNSVFPATTSNGSVLIKRRAIGNPVIPMIEASIGWETREPSEANSPVRIEISAPVMAGSVSKTVKAIGITSLAMMEFEYAQLVARKFDLEMVLPAIYSYGFSDQETSPTQVYIVTRIERIQGTINKRVYLQALEAPVLR